MNDELEGFVKNNKKKFEYKCALDRLWKRIVIELDKKKRLKKQQ